MKKYSKRVREDAAVRCQVIADYWARRDFGRPDAYRDFSSEFAVVDLGALAYDAVALAHFGHGETAALDIAASWAEAEALIRTGWSPS